MRLKNKVAIVTGGGTGIGKGIALRFAKEGATVVITGRRLNVLDETVAEIKAEGGNAISYGLGVTVEEDIKKCIDYVVDQFGTVDILVNNAGIALTADAINCTQEDWNKVIDVDLKGTWLMSKYVLPIMLEKNSGRIINISSIAGILGMNSCLAYGSAKGGVIEMTKVMASDYSPKGITVNSIAPGYIVSDMTTAFLETEEMKQAILSQQFVKRIGEPEDIAAPAVYLASDEAGYITGQTIVIDGCYSVK